MSRIKVSPTEWREEGPSRVSSFSTGFVIRSASVVGAMVPILTGASCFTETAAQADKRRERVRKANARWRAKHTAPGRGHQGTVYATEAERIEARRATWRASKERERLAHK